MEKRAKALTWWRGLREMDKINLTKKHLGQFRTPLFVTGREIEAMQEKENTILPTINLNNYSLKQLI